MVTSKLYLLALLFGLSAVAAVANGEEDDDLDALVVEVGGDDEQAGPPSSSSDGDGDFEDIAVVVGSGRGKDCFDTPLEGINPLAKPAGHFNLAFTYQNGQCKSLLVFGRGNPTRNRFESLDQCLRTCKDIIEPGCFLPAPTIQCRRNCATEPEVGARGRVKCHRCCCPPKGFTRESCNKAKFVGNGRGIFPKWYFDNDSGTCKEFIWSGQTEEGNFNRFDCKEACEKNCARRGAGGYN